MVGDRVELGIEEVREYQVGGADDEEQEGGEDKEETNDDLLEDFTFRVYQQQTEKSAKRYASGVDRYMAWMELMAERAEKNDYPQFVMDVDERDVYDYFSWLTNTEWGIETRKSYFAAVQRFYKWVNQTGRGEDITESFSIDEFTLQPRELEKDSQQTTGDDDSPCIPREEVELLWHPDNIPAPRTQ